MFVFAFLFSWKVFPVFGYVLYSIHAGNNFLIRKLCRWYSQLAPLIMLVTTSVIFMVYFCSPPEPEYDIVNN
jgi:hypothetical protein